AAAALAGAALFALAMLGAQLRAGAQSPPVERIVPAVQTISVGDAYAQFDVTAESVSNLGAYEVILQYHSAELAFPAPGDRLPGAVSGAVTVLGGPTSTPTATSTPCPSGCPTATPTMPAAPTCAGATSPTICFDPPSVSGNPGVEMTVDVDVAGVTNLGAVNFVAAYDPSLLDFVGFAPGAFLGSTSRSLFCLPAAVESGNIDQTCVTLGSSPSGPP